VNATVVAAFPGGLALSLDANPENLLATLKAPAEAPEEAGEPLDAAAVTNLWDRLRAMPHTEKLLLAPKADRAERAILIQDGDPQILFFLLKNPRITVEEVARLAKSPFLSYFMADLISKTPQWQNNDVRSGLVSNPRTPTPLALRLLPTLAQSDIKAIARGGAVSMALRQAALRIVITM
jgi:hypothetical protein